MTTVPRLIVIGAGNMASALLRGAGQGKVLTREQVWAVEPQRPRREAAQAWSGRQFAAAAEALRAAAHVEQQAAGRAQLLLAVKPQALEAAAAEARSAGPAALQGRLVISILAGTTRRRVAEALSGEGAGEGGGAGVTCIRAMPNTPAGVGRAISAIARADDLCEADLSLARGIFGAVGEVVEIEEGLMDAFTAVAGSGPAYVFRFVEALAAAAEGVGFDAALAARLSRATVTGAAALLASSDQSAAALRAAVTSKGGTTEAALEVMEREGLQRVVAAAVRAARDRGEALST